MENITKHYTNGEVTIVWQPGICIHSKMCFHGLPQVFNPAQKPWINPQAATTAQIISQVNSCPSVALSFFMNTNAASLKP